VIFLTGAAIAAYLKRRDQPRYDAIGRFVHEDA
jgi:hypothetical protein